MSLLKRGFKLAKDKMEKDPNVSSNSSSNSKKSKSERDATTGASRTMERDSTTGASRTMERDSTTGASRTMERDSIVVSSSTERCPCSNLKSKSERDATTGASLEDMENSCLCLICYEILVDPISLSCGHNICLECLNPLLVAKQKFCPGGDCKGRLPKENRIRKNTGMDYLLRQQGGVKYEQEVEERRKRIEYEKLLETYFESDRFKNLTELVTGFLKEGRYRDISEFKKTFKVLDYPAIEMRVVLNKLFQQNLFSVHQSRLIGFEFFPEYLIRNLNEISSKELVSLLISYFGVQEEFIKTISKKYPNTSELYQSIAKLSNDDLETMAKFVKQLEADGNLSNNQEDLTDESSYGYESDEVEEIEDVDDEDEDEDEDEDVEVEDLLDI